MSSTTTDKQGGPIPAEAWAAAVKWYITRIEQPGYNHQYRGFMQAIDNIIFCEAKHFFWKTSDGCLYVSSDQVELSNGGPTPIAILWQAPSPAPAPEPAIAEPVVEEQGEIARLMEENRRLMDCVVYRDHYSHQWKIVGGVKEFADTPLKACVRFVHLSHAAAIAEVRRVLKLPQEATPEPGVDEIACMNHQIKALASRVSMLEERQQTRVAPSNS